MEISTYLLETIKNQFEVFCIRVLQNEERDCYRELERLSKKMSLFSELNAEQLNGIGRMEEYDSDLYLCLDVTDDTLEMLYTLILHVITRLLVWIKNRKQLMAFALFKNPKAIFFEEQ